MVETWRVSRERSRNRARNRGDCDVADDEPTPPEVVVLNETLTVPYGEMAPHERPNLERNLQGWTVPKIVKESDLHEREAYGVLSWTWGRLDAIRGIEEGGP
jgi:hypothetical protein